MAFQSRFLTIENVYGAPLSGPAASWNDAANACNFSRDSYARATGSTYRQYGIDFDARLTSGLISFAPSWAGLIVQNYNVNFSPCSITIYSDDEPTFTSPVSNHGSINMVDCLGSGMLVKYLGGSTKRYWLWEFNSIAAVANLSMAMVGYYYDIKARWDYGSPMGIAFANRRVAIPHGDDVVVNLRDNPWAVQVRRFEMIDENDRVALESVFRTSRGSTYPFLITDRLDQLSTMSHYKLFRFAQDELLFEEVDFGVYNCDIALQEVPHVYPTSAF